MDKQQLAGFLRSRRAAIRPADVGLPDGRRRTPGLRREEVAERAHMSANYYERLEQGRAPRPSSEVLAALGRALALTDDEGAHLARIAGQMPPSPGTPSTTVSAGVQQLLDRVGHLPAYVLSAKYDVLAWNRAAALAITDFAALQPRMCNALRLAFSTDLCVGDTERFVGQAVIDLRKAAARYPADPTIPALIDELGTRHGAFGASWARADHTLRKRFRLPNGVAVDLDAQTLHVPEDDQRLVIYSAEPGTPSDDALRRLTS
ncbi:helix-turn-helix transcriptional regulator [Kutzneria sp. CA-103260]|uniref:helix-turn-helix transcriptional regulator n=1 Tax=Kutzneria sp. CA-103260 TaxID=2802641 RepID=UPI001BAB8677|nr:helix-turn-helix transcriptional regulator [Kutzneria sp. CA-103260]QUQ71988.1 DNA-binding protein [Kutzneria sp. CA-103260]